MGEMRVEDIPQLPRINNLRNGQFSLFCKYLYNSNKISKLFLVMQLLNDAVRLCQWLVLLLLFVGSKGDHAGVYNYFEVDFFFSFKKLHIIC